MSLSCRTVTIVLASFLLFAHVATTGAKPGAQKPIKENHLHLEGGREPPTTLSELWDSSEVVISGVIGSSRHADRPLLESRPTDVVVFTRYTITIEDVFKAPLKSALTKGSRIDVVRFGGLRDRGQYVESVIDDDFPQFARGERYILFLRAATRDRGAFEMATGRADSAFLLDSGSGKTIPRGRSNLALDLAAFSPEALAAVLHSQRGHSK